MNPKIAILSFDLEDISDALCFQKKRPNPPLPSGMDGAEAFLDFCKQRNIKATIFALANRLDKDLPLLKRALKEGHEIALHGYEHVLATTYALEEFVDLTKKGKEALEESLGVQVKGFRAPGWAISSEEYAALKELGFFYSSTLCFGKSWAMFSPPPSLEGAKKEGYRYRLEGLDEFSLPTIKAGLFKGLLLGGGVVPRFFPVRDVKKEILRQAKNEPYLVLNAHPFELSKIEIHYQKRLAYHDNLYLRKGRKHWVERLGVYVDLLKQNGYSFMTFDEALTQTEEKPSSPKAEAKV